MVQTIMNVIDFGMNIKEAVDAPRIHHQWLPDKVFVEPMAVSPDTAKLLADMGHAIEEQGYWGAAEAIMIGSMPVEDTSTPVPDSQVADEAGPNLLQGANDDRRPAGAAVGY